MSEAPSTVLPGIPPFIDVLMGPVLLGNLFNWGLYGVMCLQTYIYYLSFPKDARHIKILVYVLFFLETLQLVLTTINAWHFLATGWGDTAMFIDPGWSMMSIPFFSGIISMTVQTFFAWRIWKLSHSWILAGLITLVSLASGFAGSITAILFSIVYEIPKIATFWKPVTVWLGGAAASDIAITCSLVYFLAQASTGINRTDDILSRLIRLTVETGAVTSTVAVIDLILFLKFRTNNLHLIPAIPLAKLYTNTLLATLNSRSVVFTSSHNEAGVSLSGAAQTHPASRRHQTQGSRGIIVHTSTIAMVDLETQDDLGYGTDRKVEVTSDNKSESDLEGHEQSRTSGKYNRQL